MAQSNHNKIINAVAKEILQPLGLFQKGQSRTWIDDNGWFFIVVEFQPSGFDKGSYLNVGVNYLWRLCDYFAFNYGDREGHFVKYKGKDDVFCTKMEMLSIMAKDKVVEYRKFRDIKYAKKIIIKHKGYALSWELWHKTMISALTRDLSRAKKYLNLLKEKTKNSLNDWEQELYRKACNEVQPLLCDESSIHNYVIDTIKKQRAFWRQKASMKKMLSYHNYDFC
jgi:hypothetical protein